MCFDPYENIGKLNFPTNRMEPASEWRTDVTMTSLAYLCCRSLYRSSVFLTCRVDWHRPTEGHTHLFTFERNGP